MRSMIDLPPRNATARFANDFGQRFILTVDTEEEFDWAQPLARDNRALEHAPRLRKFQQFCEGLGVPPIYLVDHPVATSPIAVSILKTAVAAGKAEIGIQLHPWVSPPHEEEVNTFNSFAGNLPEPLERAKLIALRDRIRENFGTFPLIYRAGRYGLGPNTGQILRDAGVAVDSSVRSTFDYSAGGGPNYRYHPPAPYWHDDDCRLLELPLTTVFWGLLRRQGTAIYPRIRRVPRLYGALARLGLLERIPLTPEGITVDEAIRGIDIALDDGLPLIVLSFHSPSLRPGNTPYVRTEDDLDRMYDWWRHVFAYLARRGVRPATVRQVMTAALR